MNGWKNWETWEAFNIVTSYEETYLRSFETADLGKVLAEALELSGVDNDHIDISMVDFKELRKALEQGLDANRQCATMNHDNTTKEAI